MWPLATLAYVPARMTRTGAPARGAPDPPWSAPGRELRLPAGRPGTGSRSWPDLRGTPNWGASG